MDVRPGPSPAEGAGPVLIVPVFADLAPGPGAAAVLGALPWLSGHLEALRFAGKALEVTVVPTGGSLPYDTLVIVGLGEEADHESLRQAAAVAFRAAPQADRISTTVHQIEIDGAVRAVVEGSILGSYRFDAHKSEPEPVTRPDLELAGPVPDDWEEQAHVGRVVAEAVCLARDLVNEPAAGKGPDDLAARMAALAAEAGLEAEVWTEERLTAERMGGILGVGAGSHRPPRLLRLAHRPAGARATLALVGKGIVFDSGGLSLKTAENMERMKDDMAGAAAVIAAVLAVARLGVEVEVVAYTPLAENMPGGGAQRPGDVLRCRNGKTIEVLNTDAEGRLVLADALALAAETGPDLVVDVATLTGACHVALGDKIAGVWGNGSEAIDRVVGAAEAAGERVWRMPLPADYRRNIDSDVADMKNTGSNRYGGAINAALLLSEFVGEVPWVHVDIAGPAWYTAAEHYQPKGGTGFGVRTLVETARALAGGVTVGS
ncbi:MAG: leucyl aminopeptidase [Acidimicrobiia bacterium]|jgi:leucyl aminopeptidase